MSVEEKCSRYVYLISMTHHLSIKSDPLAIAGYATLLKPLETQDPIAFARIMRALESGASIEPYKSIVKKLTGKIIPEDEARAFWKNILANKQDLEDKLGRPVGIQTAAIDLIEQESYPSRKSSNDAIATLQKKKRDPSLEKIFEPGFFNEKLKDEMLRGKRYKHALAVIMVDIDEFDAVTAHLGHSGEELVLDALAKILRKTIRTVDIVARYVEDRFLVILPNTNKREAQELAERLVALIRNRAHIMLKLERPITVTGAVGQCTGDETAASFLQQLDAALENGKIKEREKVYTIPS